MTKEAWRERPGVQVRIARQEKLEDPEVEYGRAGDVEEYYEPMEEKDQRAKNTLLLWEATEAGEGEKVSHLLSNSKGDGPDVHYKGPEEWTNLHTAVSEGHFYIAKLLLDNEALVDARTASMRTALHIACIRGRLSLVKLLLNYGADINAQDADGNTAVHFCSKYGHGELLRYLLQRDPIFYVKNAEGKTPIDVA